jgi:hypothetical protein
VNNTGLYQVTVHIHGSASTGVVDIGANLYVNGIQEPRVTLRKSFKKIGEYHVMPFSGLISLTAGDGVTIRLAIVSSLSTIEFQSHNMSVSLFQIT